MKQLLELIPIVLFFVVYQMDGDTVTLAGYSHTVDGIFSATAVLLIATLIQLPLTWLATRKLERRLLWTSLAVVVFSSATLLFRNELFIQWKPTVLNWGMGIAFAGSQFIGRANLLERLMGSQLAMPSEAWSRVCWVWVGHFTIVGILNLVVAYRFDEATWVTYKLYSSVVFTLLLMVITVAMLSPWLRKAKVKQDVVESEFRP